VDLTVIVRLEEKVDQLLEQHRTLQDENRRLLARQAALEEERQLFRGELDRILGKLEGLERKTP
jgi:cell division protein FtsB